MRKALLVCVILLICAAVRSLYEPSLLAKSETVPAAWHGPELTVVFFSDLHAGAPYISQSYIESLVSRINAESPDLVLIGGDLLINGIVGGKKIGIEALAPVLSRLTSRLGVFAVLGNHDWWNDGPNVAKKLNENGVVVLENESVIISDTKSPGRESFALVGVGDDYTGHADIKKALSKVPPYVPSLLFMHDPGALLSIKQHFDFAFAGHLHGGQVFVPGLGALVTFSKVPRSWAHGEIDFPFGRLFVSKGIGTSILPVRFNATPEFVVLRLHQ